MRHAAAVPLSRWNKADARWNKADDDNRRFDVRRPHGAARRWRKGRKQNIHRQHADAESKCTDSVLMRLPDAHFAEGWLC